MKKVNLIISIDTECDKGPGWKIPKPMAFENIIHGVPKVLTPLFQAFEIKPTYLLSPEVLKSDDCMTLFKSLNNLELGTHLHGEFIEPEDYPESNRTSTPQLAYSSSVEWAKLENLTKLFESRLGYKPKSFRAGRWGISSKTLKFLEKLGYEVDSSVCSFRTHKFDNKSVNFWGAPLQPYHPDKNDFRQKGTMKLLEVPATLGNSTLIHWPRYILRHLSDDSKLHKKILHKLGRSSKIKWLRPYKSSGREMIDLAETYINKFAKRDSVVLNMMFHSNEIIPGKSPYVQNQKELDTYLESLKHLFEHLKNNHSLEAIGLSDLKKN